MTLAMHRLAAPALALVLLTAAGSSAASRQTFAPGSIVEVAGGFVAPVHTVAADVAPGAKVIPAPVSTIYRGHVSSRVPGIALSGRVEVTQAGSLLAASDISGLSTAELDVDVEEGGGQICVSYVGTAARRGRVVSVSLVYCEYEVELR